MVADGTSLSIDRRERRLPCTSAVALCDDVSVGGVRTDGPLAKRSGSYKKGSMSYSFCRMGSLDLPVIGRIRALRGQRQGQDIKKRSVDHVVPTSVFDCSE